MEDKNRSDLSDEAEQKMLSDNTSENDDHFDNAEVLPEGSAVPRQVSELTTEIPKSSERSEKKRKSFEEYCRQSVILSFIIFICSFISKLCRRSLTASIFTSYRSVSNAFSDSAIFGSRISHKLSSLNFRFKRLLQRLIAAARIPKFFNKLTYSVLCMKTSSFGLVLLIFSIGTALIHIIERFYFNFGVFDIYAPITSAVMLIVSIMLILNSGSLINTVKQSVIGSFIFFSLLGIAPPSDSSSEFSPSESGACLIGTLLAALTIFVPAHIICVAVFVIIFTLIVVKSPETGLIALILITPFVTQNVIIYICSVTIGSYILKVLCGKRAMRFEFMDLFVGAFFAILIFGGKITLGNSGGIYAPIIYTGIYFIAVSILRTPIWFKRTVNTVLLSSVFLTLYAAFILVFKNIIDLPIDFTPQTDIGNADVTIFASVSLLGVIVIYSIFYVLSEFLITRSYTHKTALFFITCFAVFFIFTNLSPTAKIATALSIILFFILYSKKTAILFTLLVMMIPFVPLFISSFSTLIHNFFEPEAYRADIWKSVLYMLIGNVLPENAGSIFTSFGITGVGFGTEAFKEAFALCYPGAPNVPSHAYSLLGQIFTSFGLFGALTFGAILFFIMQNCFSFGRSCIDKQLPARIYNYAGMCSVIALSLCGIGEYIWYNQRVILIFWIICAVAVSAKRSSENYIGNNIEFREISEYRDLI